MTTTNTDTIAVKTYESDGGDGYSEGCWGVIVVFNDAERVASDGGFATKDRAERRGQELVSALAAAWGR